MDNLAPGVMSNILVHGVGMALIPIMTFFMLHWMGFSGVWCAISKSKTIVTSSADLFESIRGQTGNIPTVSGLWIPDSHHRYDNENKDFVSDAVLMVHLCLGSFIYRAWKEEVNSGFEKKALEKDD